MTHRLLLLALLAFALAYTFAARSIPMDAWTAAETVNTRTLPTLYGVLLSVVLVILLIQPPPASQRVGLGRWLRAGGLCAGLAAAAFAVPVVGLWPTLAVLLGASAWWLGERRAGVLAAVALGIPLAGYLGIEQLLGVYLP